MFSFDKLSRAAQRAAFANMAKTGAAKKVAQAATHKPAPIHPNLTKRYSYTATGKDGKIRSLGTISLAEAAVQMFGTKGAQERIAKYNARHGGKAARKMAAAKPK
jgi:hypothetical protein